MEVAYGGVIKSVGCQHGLHCTNGFCQLPCNNHRFDRADFQRLTEHVAGCKPSTASIIPVISQHWRPSTLPCPTAAADRFMTLIAGIGKNHDPTRYPHGS